MICEECGSEDLVIYDFLKMGNEFGEYVVEYYRCNKCGNEQEVIK